jgi:hypothetical protein
VEEVTHGRRNSVLTLISFLFLYSPFLQSQRPSERYQAATEAGRIEPALRAMVAACLGTRILPSPVQLYSQGAWFVTPDLAKHMKEQGSDDDGTAQVWRLNGRPRAVSQWTHDDEFDRHTFACMNDAGIVTRQENEYMPGLSEPDLHWVSIHIFTRLPDGKYRTASRYTDWTGHAIPPPKLTSEDRDFIAGERRYTQWKDFDFADRLRAQSK